MLPLCDLAGLDFPDYFIDNLRLEKHTALGEQKAKIAFVGTH